MQLPQLTTSLENCSILPSDCNCLQSYVYSSSSYNFTQPSKITISRHVDTNQAANKQVAFNHQVPVSIQVSYQNSVPQVSSGKSISIYSIDSISSQNDSHYSSKILTSSERANRCSVTNTDLEVTTSTVVDTEQTGTDQPVSSDEGVNRNQAVAAQATTDQVTGSNWFGYTELASEDELLDTVNVPFPADFVCDWKQDKETLSMSSISSELLKDLDDDYWDRVSCSSNYSGSSNTTYSIDTELLSVDDFPTSDAMCLVVEDDLN